MGTNAFSIDDKNHIKGIRFTNSDSNLYSVKKFIHPTIIGKTEWFLNNPYDEKAIRIEDAELWFRTREFSCFIQINQPLLFYREYGGSYYKKYKKGIIPMIYVALKYYQESHFIKMFKWIFKTILHIVKSLVFYIYFIFNMELKLIESRVLSISKKCYDKAISDLNKAIAK